MGRKGNQRRREGICSQWNATCELVSVEGMLELENHFCSLHSKNCLRKLSPVHIKSRGYIFICLLVVREKEVTKSRNQTVP